MPGVWFDKTYPGHGGVGLILENDEIIACAAKGSQSARPEKCEEERGNLSRFPQYQNHVSQPSSLAL